MMQELCPWVNHVAVVALMSLASHSAQPVLNSLTLSNDLLTVYKVARGFESSLLRQPVLDVRDSQETSAKYLHAVAT